MPKSPKCIGEKWVDEKDIHGDAPLILLFCAGDSSLGDYSRSGGKLAIATAR